MPSTYTVKNCASIYALRFSELPKRRKNRSHNNRNLKFAEIRCESMRGRGRMNETHQTIVQQNESAKMSKNNTGTCTHFEGRAVTKTN